MKTLNQYINEHKFIKDINVHKPIININEHIVGKITHYNDNDYNKTYNYHPESYDELKKAIDEHLNDKNYDFNDIDTSKIDWMGKLFADKKFSNINFDVSKWDVSNVTSMVYMFSGCHKFNCDLSKWDVSKLERAESMFQYCKSFNSNLSNWDVSNVKSALNMFYKCVSFEGKGLKNWKLNDAWNLSHMFYECTSLNEDLSQWDVSKVTQFGGMFAYCGDKLHLDISNWKIINKASLYHMCYVAPNITWDENFEKQLSERQLDDINNKE